MAISFVSSAGANATSTNISTPTLGNIILVFAYNGSSGVAPTLGAGYTGIVSASSGSTAGRAAYKISNGSETNTGSWANATSTLALVYSGVLGIGSAVSAVGSGALLNYRTLSLLNSDDTSWIIGFGGAISASAGMNGTTPQLISNRINETTANGLDTGGKVSIFPSGNTLGVTGSGQWLTHTIELLVAPVDPTPASNWSPKDTRQAIFGFGPGPNIGLVQDSGAEFFLGQESSNSAVPSEDCRVAGPPVDSRAAGAPMNSRVSPNGFS